MKIKPINVSIILNQKKHINRFNSDIETTKNDIAEALRVVAEYKQALETKTPPMYYMYDKSQDLCIQLQKDIDRWEKRIANLTKSIEESKQAKVKYLTKVLKYEKMLSDAINDVQAKCRVRKIIPENVFYAIRAIERDLCLPIKKMNGVHAWINPNYQTFKRAYNGIPESTYFGVFYKNGNWYMDRICRTICRNQYIALTLPEEARNYIIERIENGK